MILSLWRKDPLRDAAEALYAAAADQARNVRFFADWGVPDTPEGRFEVLAAILSLLLNRLSDEGPEAQRLQRRLSETLFDQLDAALRELGVGDLSVGRKNRKLAEDFFGRATAYRAALFAGDEDALRIAVARNVYGATEGGAEIAAYLRAAAVALAAQPTARILQGVVSFPETGA
ncbi:MAG: hypothetical protein K2Q06_01395 [Parvularculaceae bacterium]|nr:hypothetical protein [Parvularculaceae bacterium]